MVSNILQRAAQTVLKFQLLASALDDGSRGLSIDSEALQDEFGRFRVWSGNLGALQKGHSSLDYRLRDSPLLAGNTLKLLEELEENLSEALAVASGQRLPYEQQAKPEKSEEEADDDGFFSDDDDDDDESDSCEAPKTELEQRLREIIDIIDNLYKLSVRIRQPTLRNRSLKAASYAPKDSETGVDILDQYAIFDLQHTRELIASLRIGHTEEGEAEKDILVGRLSQAITLRRRQFKYWRRHRDKLAVSSVRMEDIPHEDLGPSDQKRFDATNLRDAHLAQPIDALVAPFKATVSEKTGKTMLSGTEATHHHLSLDELIDSKSVTSYATTVRDLTGRGIELPAPPKAADGEKDFECPYCFIICPARYGKGKPWRTHLLQDLQPYVCTYAECDGPTQLFRSRREWVEHEASHRKAWRCPEHPSAIYRSPSDLKQHLLQNHAGSIPENQLHSIIKVGETSTVDVREQCPICFADAEAEGLQGNLQNHIANHLERLATFALPPTNSIEDDSDGGSSAASRGRRGTTVTYSNPDDASDRSSLNSMQKLDALERKIRWKEEQTSTNPIPSSGGLLSAETLGALPDSSQKRLDFLLSNDATANAPESQGSITSVNGQFLATDEMIELKEYLQILPGFQALKLLRQFGQWRYHAQFQDEDLAKRAGINFDSHRFEAVKVTQRSTKPNVLNLSLPASYMVKQLDSDSHSEDGEDSSSSIAMSYDSFDDNGKSILTLADMPTLRSLYVSRKLRQRDQSYAPSVEYNSIISLCNYDITRLQVDAIVNSANAANKITRTVDSLNHYIHRVAGPGLQKECSEAGRTAEGQATLTSGHNLPSPFVIHAARPQYSGSKRRRTQKFDALSNCYRSSLDVAMEHNIKTIAFPCLAAGGCGFPQRVAARLAIQAVRDYLDTHRDHHFERIIFCVFSKNDETAYIDLLPVIFPPSHRDIEDAQVSAIKDGLTSVREASPVIPSGKDDSNMRDQLRDAYTQVDQMYQDLLAFSDVVEGFRSSVLGTVSRISGTLRLIETSEAIGRLSLKIRADINLLCSVLQSACGGVAEIIEQTKFTRDFGNPTYKTIWDEYNFHMQNSQGLDFERLMVFCEDFVQCLRDMLIFNVPEPHQLSTIRLRLGSYRLKQTGEGEEGVRDRFEEVMYTREFHRGAVPQNRADVIKLHHIPSLVRLYQIGELQYRPTNSIPDNRLNYAVSLLREDITRIECDVICNSTDTLFSGQGTLDRTVFRKGGPEMQEVISKFGPAKEGDIRVTPGYLLPARHVIHAIPPDTYRTNTKEALRQLYREVLWRATALKATSLAIPAIGTGMLNYPRRDCASLAMEEVKRFLETADAESRIEKIIFVVYGSNDELIYKSLLPTFFPPVNTNTNKALRSQADSSMGPKSPSSAEAAESSTPRRTLFSSVGEALGNVRSGQSIPVPEPSGRPLQAAEEFALVDLEVHAADCFECYSTTLLDADGQHLCREGHEAAQTAARYLFMEADGFMYSTKLENGERAKIHVPPEYSKSLDILSNMRGTDQAGSQGSAFAGSSELHSKPSQSQTRSEEGAVSVIQERKGMHSTISQAESVERNRLLADEDYVMSKERAFADQQEREDAVSSRLQLMYPNERAVVEQIEKAVKEAMPRRQQHDTEHSISHDSSAIAEIENEARRPGTDIPPTNSEQDVLVVSVFSVGVEDAEDLAPLFENQCRLSIRPGKVDIIELKEPLSLSPSMTLEISSGVYIARFLHTNILIARDPEQKSILLRSQNQANRDIVLRLLRGAKVDPTTQKETYQLPQFTTTPTTLWPDSQFARSSEPLETKPSAPSLLTQQIRDDRHGGAGFSTIEPSKIAESSKTPPSQVARNPPDNATWTAEQTLDTIRAGPADGMHVRTIASNLNLGIHATLQATEELQNGGHIFRTYDDRTFAAVDNVPGDAPAGRTFAIAQRVLAEIVLSPFPEGLHVDQIAKALGEDISVIRRALSQLEQAGRIYNTIDDDTYAALDEEYLAGPREEGSPDLLPIVRPASAVEDKHSPANSALQVKAPSFPNSFKDPSFIADVAAKSHLPKDASWDTKRVLAYLQTMPEDNEGIGFHQYVIAQELGLNVIDVMQIGEALMSWGMIYSTIDDQHWLPLDNWAEDRAERNDVDQEGSVTQERSSTHTSTAFLNPATVEMTAARSELLKDADWNTKLLFAYLQLKLEDKEGTGFDRRAIAEELDLSLHQVSEAGETLLSLGLIYETIDDDHWLAINRLEGEAFDILLRETLPSPNLHPHSSQASSNPADVDEESQQTTSVKSTEEASSEANPRLDLSISGLSSVNIDDYFTYIELLSTSKPEESQFTKPKSSQTFSHFSSAGEPSTSDSISEGIKDGNDNDDEDDNNLSSTVPASKKSRPISLGRRWTKIDRRIVNPQALRASGEKFEEKEDHVIVFRVVDREEIMLLTEQTREIRRGRKQDAMGMIADALAK